MRRVREFIVVFKAGDTASELNCEGWHQACRAIAEALSQGIEEATILPKHHRNLVVGRFCSERLDTIQSRDRCQWRSDVFKQVSESEVWFANYNISDFLWELLDGAKREVPFEMSFIHRWANRHPDGVFGTTLSLLSECRERFTFRR